MAQSDLSFIVKFNATHNGWLASFFKNAVVAGGPGGEGEQAKSPQAK